MFAHPNRAENGFAANKGSQASLLPGWWQTGDHRYDFVYAHVCNGASVLERGPWSAVFPRWVSYNMTVEVFLATGRAQEQWTLLGCELVQAAWESENVNALFSRVKGTYEMAMARVHDSYDPSGGDDITLAYLEKAIAALAVRTA